MLCEEGVSAFQRDHGRDRHSLDFPCDDFHLRQRRLLVVSRNPLRAAALQLVSSQGRHGYELEGI